MKQQFETMQGESRNLTSHNCLYVYKKPSSCWCIVHCVVFVACIVQLALTEIRCIVERKQFYLIYKTKRSWGTLKIFLCWWHWGFSYPCYFTRGNEKTGQYWYMLAKETGIEMVTFISRLLRKIILYSNPDHCDNGDFICIDYHAQSFQYNVKC